MSGPLGIDAPEPVRIADLTGKMVYNIHPVHKARKYCRITEITIPDFNSP
jgi:hypothetical protein